MSDPARTHLHTSLDWQAVAGKIETVLSEFAVSVMVQDIKGRIVYANPAAAKRMNSTPRDLRHRPAVSTSRRYRVYDQSDNLVADAQLPSRRVLDGADWAEAILHFMPKLSGEEFWLIIKAVPIQDDEGETQFVVTISYDITMLKQAEIQLRNNNSRLMGMLEGVMETKEFDGEPRRRGDKSFS